MVNKTIFKKWASAVFGIFFTFAQIFSYADTALGKALSVSGEPSFYEPVDALALPETEGIVEAVFKGAQLGWVAIIKDAHAIPQTQNSIAQILTRLENIYGVDWVGAEGATGKFQTELFRSFPNSQYLKNHLNHFAERGELGGVALAALTSKGTAVFEGVEDPQTYESGLNDYQRARAELEGWNSLISKAEQKILPLKKKHYSLRAQNWDLKISRMDSAGANAQAWMSVLREMRSRIPHFSKKYPNLNTVWIEMRISRAGVGSMRPRIQDWKRALERTDPTLSQLAIWQADFQAWRTGGLSDAEYAVRLQVFGEAREIKMRLPESLSALVSLGNRLKALHGGAWVQEWGLAKAEAEQFIFEGKEERQIFELDQKLEKIKKAVDLKVSREEWLSLIQAKQSHDAVPTNDVKVLAATTDLENLNERFLKSAAADFYKGAIQREDYFESKLSQNLNQKKGRRTAVVLGGFHADALADSLRKKDISFVVLMPATGAIPETTLYENLMRGEVSWSSHFKFVNGSIQIYESFAAAMIHRLLDLKQQKQNPKQILAYFKSWRENLMRGILNAKQSEEALSALNLFDREVLSAIYGKDFKDAHVQGPGRPTFSTLIGGRNGFRTAAGMTIQPWVAAPLGDLSLRTTSPLSGGTFKAPEKPRSEMRVLPREQTDSDQKLSQLWKAKLEKDGSFSKKISTLEELKQISDSAQEKGYVIVLPSVASVEQMLQLQFPATIRVYPRQVEADSFEKAMEIMLERQIRAGRVIEENGVLRWQPFMQIFEDGKTVIYVVYQKGKLAPELFEGGVSDEIQKNAEHIFVFNPARAKRPGAAAPAAQKPPNDHPDLSPPAKTIEVAPPHIQSQIPEQMFFWVAAEGVKDPSQRWMVVVNRYPVLPPSLDAGPEAQPQAIVLSRDVELGRKSYAQSWMHRPENLSDILQTHAELEGVPQEKRSSLSDLAGYLSFAVGAIFNSEKPDSHNVLIVGKNTNHVLAVNGYRHPDAPLAAHGGASQLHGHAQHVNAYLPIKNVPPEAFTKITTLPLGENHADVLLMNWEGKTALVVDYGSQRIFIFSRPNGKPAKFDGNFSFLELGGMIVVASIARLFQLNPTETQSLTQAPDPSNWLLDHRAALIERGVDLKLLDDAREAFSSQHEPMTASSETMLRLAHDLKDLRHLQGFADEKSLPVERDSLFQVMKYSPTEAGKLLSPAKDRFVWKKGDEEQPLLLSEKFPKGILALVMQFKELAVWGREAERGQVALRSMRFHAAGGHLFAYLKYILADSGVAMRPFSKKIEALAESAEKALAQMKKEKDFLQMEHHFEKALSANYEALRLIDQLGEWMAEQALAYYLNEESSGSGLEWFYQNIVSNRNLRKYISRALSVSQDAVRFDTDERGLHAYRIRHNGKERVLAIDIGAIPTPGENDSQRKVLGSIVAGEAWQKLLVDMQVKPGAPYQITDVKAGKKERRFLFMEQNMPLEIPEPQGLQLLEVEPQARRFAGMTIARTSGVNVRELQASIEKVLSQPEQMRELLEDLTVAAAEAAMDEAGRKRLFAFMTLIGALDPSLLESMRDWNPFVYASLKKVIVQNPEFFSEAAQVAFHEPSRSGAMVFSRVLESSKDKWGDNGKNIVFALQFDDGPVNRDDGKVWSVVRDLGSGKKPLHLDPGAMYQVQNLLEANQPIYERQASGAEFMRHWDVGIPVYEGKNAGHFKQQHGWGIDIYRILSVYPAQPHDTPQSMVSMPIMPELLGAVNLMDVGAEKRMDGKTSYSDSFQKLKRLLPFLRSLGYGKVYLYGGLYEMGEISRRLHGEAGDPSRYIVDNDAFPRTMIRGGYSVKRDGVLADDQGNSFSPISMLELNPRLSDSYGEHGFSKGTHSKSKQQVAEVAAEAKKMGMKVVADFIPWLAPEGVTEENYKMFFYKEVPDNFTIAKYGKSFSQLPEDKKQEAMRGIIGDSFFVKRFGEPGNDRLVLIRHMFNEPGVDQAMPNPFHPLTQKYYLDTLKHRLEEGIEEVRVDLAHKLLNVNLKPIFDGWLVDGWQVGEGGQYRSDEEPFETVIREAKTYAKAQGRSLEFDMEAYGGYEGSHVDVHRQLQAIGADRAYFVPVHHDYHRLAKGAIDTNHFQPLFELVHELKNGKLGGQSVPPLLEMIFASNYDEPSLNQMGGPKRAMWLLLLLMAKSGVPVMMDLRDVMDHFGQFITIPGERHPFPTGSERERRRDFKGLVSELERSPALQEARALLALENSEKPIQLSFLDNQKRYQFMATAWKNPELGAAEVPEWRVALMNFKPANDEVIWVEAPVKAGAWVAEDVLTGETFSIQNGRIQGIVMPSTLSYRALKIVPAQRSEIRAEIPRQNFMETGDVAIELAELYPEDFVPRVIVEQGAEQAHGDLSEVKKTIRAMIHELDDFVAAHPDRDLNLGFIMAYDTELSEEFVLLAKKIQNLKRAHGDRIHNQLQVVFTQDQMREDRNIFDEIQATQTQAKVWSRHLKPHPAVFVYGLMIDAGANLEHLVVQTGGYSMAAVFPAALEMNLRTAGEGRITAAILEQVPQDLVGVFGRAGRALKILSGVLEAKWLEIAAQRVILSAA